MSIKKNFIPPQNKFLAMSRQFTVIKQKDLCKNQPQGPDIQFSLLAYLAPMLKLTDFCQFSLARMEPY